MAAKPTLRAIVFDFDGVIIDSNQMKYNAFFQIFSDDPRYTDIVRGVLSRHREESRFEIIKRILYQASKSFVCGVKNVDQKLLFYAEQYNDIVEQGAITCEEMPGARTSLEILSRKYPLYINSTTPIEPLKRIISRRGLESFFQEIYGGPGSKIQNLSEILGKGGITPSETLVVGDGKSDLQSANKLGCNFIGIRNESSCSFDGRDFIVIPDLRKLPNIIDTVYETN